MSVFTSCITSTLQPYVPSTENPWNAERIRHAYRRLGYDANKATINSALALNPNDLIDQLIDESVNAPAWPEPVWADFTNDDYSNLGFDFNEQTQLNHKEVFLELMNQMQTTGLKGRLILFWSNHFVTRLEDYYASNHLYQYYRTIEEHMLSNFQDFVGDIGKTTAMLLFLNGFENTNNSPNENYARELYELFTLGVDNGYTQEDIVETSKALTGYNHRENWTYPIYYDTSTFDNSDKIIFGQEGNWDYDGLINLLFQERAPQIAAHICKKLYTYFVSATVNEDVIADMASVFVQDFNIANILRILFKSDHFFDSKTIGIQIKSPYDMTMAYLNITNFSMQQDHYEGMVWFNNVLGQQMFEPIDVAGWQGDRDWINASTLTGRWQILKWIIWHTWNNFNEELRTFAIESSDNSNDVYIIAKSIIDRFIPLELYSVEDYQIATDIFKHNLPENYYEDQIWNLQYESVPYQVVLLLLHLIKTPEFQLK
ncbi:DUF1800 domain-containing protein [Winogradskyella sp. UBA3174]|uniref:DUF1800 domain-containing protein n=1 Tax=Winogradskyella sp. UBA3174 TaxID=1947785 RepID=UPI0025DF6335|nr:DUF1800 domain-containing protein [Winogradskyella sp. UBA3174]|tara:strand:- start:27426 stop:28883 length:1458 start_codon:yes stop_codon:yes gene_type:complete